MKLKEMKTLLQELKSKDDCCNKRSKRLYVELHKQKLCLECKLENMIKELENEHNTQE